VVAREDTCVAPRVQQGRMCVVCGVCVCGEGCVLIECLLIAMQTHINGSNFEFVISCKQCTHTVGTAVRNLQELLVCVSVLVCNQEQQVVEF